MVELERRKLPIAVKVRFQEHSFDHGMVRDRFAGQPPLPVPVSKVDAERMRRRGNEHDASKHETCNHPQA